MEFNSFQTRKLEELIGEFAKGKQGQIELEIRFTPPDEETFKRVFADFLNEHSKSTAVIEQSISIMTESDKSGLNRKELFFKDGVKQKTEHSRKHRKGMLVVKSHAKQELYRVALSSEELAPEFGMSLAHRIRIKLRCSVIVGDWRYDFTTVAQLEKPQFAQLKAVKQKMFPNVKIDPKNFLDSLPDMQGLRYEFEAEYVGDAKKLTLKSIGEAVSTFTKHLSSGEDFVQVSDIQNTIADLAKHLIDDRRVQGLFKTRFGLKQLYNNPKNLTKAGFFNTVLPQIDQYYVSDKADGERCLVKIAYDTSGPKRKITHLDIVLADKVIDMTKQFVGSAPIERDEPDRIITLIDAEIVNINREDPANSTHPRLYLFDILLYIGEVVAKLPFEEREKLLDPYAKELKATEKKILRRLTKADYGKTIREVYTRKTRAYPIDGLVFTPAHSLGNRARYNKPIDYFDMVVYKWKPPEMMSVDFLVLRAPKTMLGTKPYLPIKGKTLYILFNGINMRDSRILGLPDLKGSREMLQDIPNSGNYFPVQFSHSSFPYAYMYYHPENEGELHQQIGEFIWNKTKREWKLERLRPDKAILVKQGIAFGNNYKVAEEIFNNYLNPLSLEMMTDVKRTEHKNGQNYFLEEKQSMYKPLTKMNNFVKAQLIRQLEGKPWVVDLASGKGQDLFTYNGFEVQNALFTDIDQSALEELRNRKWNLGNTNVYVFSHAPKTNIKIYTMQWDLTNSADGFIDELSERGMPVPVGQVDGVVINLALHYIMTDVKRLQNIVKLVGKLLKSGGVFIFTTFDGARVFKLLEKVNTGDSWSLEQDGNVKYSLKKLYKDTSFKMGLRIGVVHPFSRGEHYEEPLADIDLIIKQFEQAQFKLLQRGSFADWRDKFAKFNPQIARTLTANDKTYGALYTYVSLVKQ